jgi:hypothetical protein
LLRQLNRLAAWKHCFHLNNAELARYKISFAFVWYAFNPEADIIR